MSKKVSRISINKLESTVQDNVIVIQMVDYPDIEITIRRILPLHDVLQFVEDVVSSCFDSETGRYMPEIQPFVIRASILTMYANFTLPKDPEKQYDLLYNTGAYQQVMRNIDRVQYDEILYAINERIRHETAMAESAMIGKISELTSKIDTFISNSEEMFGSVKSEDMSALIKNLAGYKSVDEDKLVKAVYAAKNVEDAGAEVDPVVSADGDVVTVRKKKD